MTSAAAAEPADEDAWSVLPLTPDHASLLASAAITPEVAHTAGVRSILDPADLPEEFAAYGPRVLPALAFPYRSPDGQTAVQLRPDDPGTGGKYLWVKGQPLILNALADGNDGPVLIVEGTKQALAAASYSPADAAVYGMVGCRGWYREGAPTPELEVVDGRDVVVILDADAATNHDVYTAGVDLAEACDAEGATSVKFVRLPGGKKAGLDDVLGSRVPERRAAYLARLIANAKSKPADAKPKPSKQKKSTAPAGLEDPTRPQIVVNGDRHHVINQLTDALIARWDGTRLFSFGGVVAQLKGHDMQPVKPNVFADIVAETAVTVATGKEGDTYFAWPDTQTMGATLSRADRYAELDKVSRAPFVRPDGTICQTPGYDPDTRTVLVLDERLGQVAVPDEPTDLQVLAARNLLLDEWLGDFDFATEADRANALALVLTPFIRGMVPLAPLAVVSARQSSSGKNLLLGCINLLVCGETVDPLGYTDEEAEQRKLITTAFQTGSGMFVFDEAHFIRGLPLARALTATTWTDRILGGNNMAEYPNRVTWVALGNKVRVEGDLVRRVYRISLSPKVDNPADRDQSCFKHPDIHEWTREHRADLLSACLTLIRAWFAAGKRPPSRGVSFGSFEAWERMVGGVIERCGVTGFLANMKDFRAEANVEAGYWEGHFAWLHETFGDAGFTTAQVAEHLQMDPDPEFPPGMPDPKVGDYARDLGMAYRGKCDVVLGGYRLVKLGQAHRGRVKWAVTHVNALSEPAQPQEPAAPGEYGDTGDTPTTRIHAGKTHAPTHDDAHTRVTRAVSSGGGASGVSILSVLPAELGEQAESDTPRETNRSAAALDDVPLPDESPEDPFEDAPRSEPVDIPTPVASGGMPNQPRGSLWADPDDSDEMEWSA